MVKLFCAFFFWCHKNHVPDKKAKTYDKPLLPPPPSSAVHPTHFPRSPRDTDMEISITLSKN